MTVPIDALVFDQPMDPKDVLPWGFPVSRAGGEDPSPMLEAGQEVASFSIGPSIEGIALGLSIKSGGGYDPFLSGDVVYFYPIIDPGSQNASAFSGTGVELGIELTIVRGTTPSTQMQRSGGLTVRQR